MRIRVTQTLLDLLAGHRVSTAESGQRWSVGDTIWVHPDAIVEGYSHLPVGHVIPRVMMAFSYIWSECDPTLRIGRYSSVAERVSIMGAPHPTQWLSTSPFSYRSAPRRPFRDYFRDSGGNEALLDFDHGTRRVTIGHDVWVGGDVMIKRGVEIGQGAVLGAGSVVTRNVAPYAIVGGAPARVIRYRFAEPLIERLLASQWWRYGPDALQPLDVRDPARLLDQLEAAIADGARAARVPILTGKAIIEAGERLS